jgi:hypothetical protein
MAWNKTKDIRDAIQLSKLVDNVDDVMIVARTIMKYKSEKWDEGASREEIRGKLIPALTASIIVIMSGHLLMANARKQRMEQEIECPRCYDIMTLSSIFGRLGYTCQKCDLLLVMK